MAERLIDAEALKKKFILSDSGVVARSIIDDAPTIDAVVPVHAEWINASRPDVNYNVTCNCSNCGAPDKHTKGFYAPFCWKCGSKMDDEKESEGK